MGESVSRVSCAVRLSLCLPPLFLLCVPAPTLAFDLGSLVAAFTFTFTKTPQPCPVSCQCTTRRAEDVMQDYVSRYLPSMAAHMAPQLESELRSTVAVMTSWLGNMADIRCRLAEGERLNLTEASQASTLSFKSVHVTCQTGASVVWDVSTVDAFLNVLHVSGCALEQAADQSMMFVPLHLWVLELEGVPAESANSLDLSQASQLRTFSFTHSDLSSLPQHWSEHTFEHLLFVSLAHNRLRDYGCEVKASQLKTISLDYNKMVAVPKCFLDGSKYSNHLSLRHNQVNSLQGLLLNKSEVVSSLTSQITYLDLAHNQVDSLRALKKMQWLMGLDLSHNHLDSVAPDTFSLHPRLVWLDLSNNFLEHVAESMLSSLVKVKHFNLSHNYLRFFDFEQNVLTSELMILDLRHNRLTFPPFADTAHVAPRQARISAAHNPFLCDCSIHAFLQLYGILNKTEQKTWLSFSNLYFYRHRSVNDQPFVDFDEFVCGRPPEMKGLHLVSLSFQETCPLPRGCPKDCKCELIKKGAAHVSVDCSHTDSLTELPDGLPFVPDTPMVLYVNKSGLKRLDHRPYLHRVRELHAASSKLTSVTSEALMALQNVSVLDLHNTQLRSLPALTMNLTLPAVTNMSLSGNPWTCGCRDLWMPAWLTRHAAALNDTDQIRCRWTGKLVTELTSSDMNCGVLDYLPLTIALSLLTGLIIVIISFVAKYRLEILVSIYTHFGLRPFDMFKYDQAKPFLFDIFLSFSEQDYSWVVETLTEHLENRDKTYRLCTHLRDFPVGATFADSVAWAVDNSRCTLLVLTRDFLTNEWSRPNVRASHLRLFQEAVHNVLVIIHGPLDARCLDRELLSYLRTHVYFKSEEALFWSKLDYALPKPQEVVLMTHDAGCRRGQTETSDVTEIGCCLLSGGLAAGDISPSKACASSVPTR